MLINSHNKFIKIKGLMLKLAKIDSIQKKINQYSYANTDSIGKGFSSQVFKGRNELTDQQVAIKMIDLRFIKGDVHKNLLANQIEILKLLKNLPHILEFYEVFNTKNNTCIITELCEGGDLSKLLKEKKTVPEAEALNILRQIINGYRGIYKFGIIHRDLKPANIFFVNGKVKIADFGFAVKQENIKKECSYNVGSPVYMPLEALNQNLYSFKSDIWAIGVIFYEMLTGKTPWRAKTQSDLKRQIKNTHIKTILPPNISPLSAEFLKRTLQPNPVLRMSPDELERFFSRSESTAVTDTQNDKIDTVNLFMTQKRNPAQFRTRAISNQKDDRIPKNETHYGKYPLNFDVTVSDRRKGFLKGLGETGMNFDNLGRTTATIGKKTDSNFFCDFKKQFQHFISQIHFCRFLYKLIDRMSKAFNIDTNKKVRSQMTELIFQKLKQVGQLNGLELKNREYFRSTPEYGKLVSIIGQYEEKYREALSEFVCGEVGDEHCEEGELSEMISKEIQSLFLFIESIDNPQEICQQVILLDYLITSKQLLHILHSSNLSEFHSKSKIQAIVNGKPTKNITHDHIRAIKDKLRTMKLI